MSGPKYSQELHERMDKLETYIRHIIEDDTKASAIIGALRALVACAMTEAKLDVLEDAQTRIMEVLTNTKEAPRG